MYIFICSVILSCIYSWDNLAYTLPRWKLFGRLRGNDLANASWLFPYILISLLCNFMCRINHFRRKKPAVIDIPVQWLLCKEILGQDTYSFYNLLSGFWWCSDKLTKLHHYVRENFFIPQPRRISAVSVAERVSYERGEQPGQSCGYSVRFESVLPRPHASVMFCTVGLYCFVYVCSLLIMGLNSLS